MPPCEEYELSGVLDSSRCSCLFVLLCTIEDVVCTMHDSIIARPMHTHLVVNFTRCSAVMASRLQLEHDIASLIGAVHGLRGLGSTLYLYRLRVKVPSWRLYFIKADAIPSQGIPSEYEGIPA